MSHEELRDQYELFVLGLADAEAAAEIEAKIAAGDAETLRGLAAAQELVTALALTAPEVEPPPALKRRILAAVGKEPSGFRGWMLAWAAATAVLVVGVVFFAIEEQRRTRELAQVRQELLSSNLELRSSNVRLQTASQLLEFLNEPQLRVVTFGQPSPQPPRGRVLVSPSRGVLLLVANLPPATPGRTYQMWVVPKSGAPVSAGLFQTGADGRALHVDTRPLDLGATAAVAVSDEPAAGSAAPTTPPFIVAPVGE